MKSIYTKDTNNNNSVHKSVILASTDVQASVTYDNSPVNNKCYIVNLFEKPDENSESFAYVPYFMSDENGKKYSYTNQTKWGGYYQKTRFINVRDYHSFINENSGWSAYFNDDSNTNLNWGQYKVKTPYIAYNKQANYGSFGFDPYNHTIQTNYVTASPFKSIIPSYYNNPDIVVKTFSGDRATNTDISISSKSKFVRVGYQAIISGNDLDTTFSNDPDKPLFTRFLPINIKGGVVTGSSLSTAQGNMKLYYVGGVDNSQYLNFRDSFKLDWHKLRTNVYYIEDKKFKDLEMGFFDGTIKKGNQKYNGNTAYFTDEWSESRWRTINDEHAFKNILADAKAKYGNTVEGDPVYKTYLNQPIVMHNNIGYSIPPAVPTYIGGVSANYLITARGSDENHVKFYTGSTATYESSKWVDLNYIQPPSNYITRTLKNNIYQIEYYVGGKTNISEHLNDFTQNFADATMFTVPELNYGTYSIFTGASNPYTDDYNFASATVNDYFSPSGTVFYSYNDAAYILNQISNRSQSSIDTYGFNHFLYYDMVRSEYRSLGPQEDTRIIALNYMLEPITENCNYEKYDNPTTLDDTLTDQTSVYYHTFNTPVKMNNGKITMRITGQTSLQSTTSQLTLWINNGSSDSYTGNFRLTIDPNDDKVGYITLTYNGSIRKFDFGYPFWGQTRMQLHVEFDQNLIYKYYMLKITENEGSIGGKGSNNSGNYVGLNRIELHDAGGRIPLTYVTGSNGYVDGKGPQNAFNDNANSNWLTKRNDGTDFTAHNDLRVGDWNNSPAYLIFKGPGIYNDFINYSNEVATYRLYMYDTNTTSPSTAFCTPRCWQLFRSDVPLTDPNSTGWDCIDIRFNERNPQNLTTGFNEFYIEY